MASHSLGRGGAELCKCPLCLSLGRIGQVILNSERTQRFRSEWLQRVRLFEIELLDAAAVDLEQAASPLAAPPAREETPKESRKVPEVESTPLRERKGKDRSAHQERRARSEDSRGKKKEKDSHKKDRKSEPHHQKSRKEKKKDHKSDEPERLLSKTPLRSPRKEKKRKERSQSPVGEKTKRSRRREGESEAASGSRFVPVKKELTPSPSRSPAGRGQRARASGSLKSSSTSPVPPPPEATPKRVPAPPSYPPPGDHRFREEGPNRESYVPSGKWVQRRDGHYYLEKEKNKGVKKKDRQREIRTAGGLAEWHATKDQR